MNIIFRDFNISLKARERSFRQNINKETVTLNDTLDQMDLTDIYRMFHIKTVEYILFKFT